MKFSDSEKELSQMREKVRKAKKDSDYCKKQVAEYTAAIEAAQRENDALEREKKGRPSHIIAVSR